MMILGTVLRRKTLILAGMLVSILAVGGCGDGGPAPTPTSEPASPTRMVVEVPTDTPVPPTPTSTQSPTATATTAPTLTPTQTPTATLTSTSTQVPTLTPTQTATVAPTSTKAPTQTPTTAPSPTEAAAAETEDVEPSGPSASDLIDSAADRFNAVRSVTFQLEVEGGAIDLGAGLVVDNMAGVFAHPDRAELSTTASTPQGKVELKLIKIGSDLYLQNPFSGEWQAVPPGTSQLESLNQFAVVEVFRGASDLTLVDREQVGGIDTWRLRGTLTPDALVPVLGLILGEEPIESEMWVGVEDQLPHKILLTVPTDSGGDLMVEILLSEFDEPVTIDPP